MLADEQQFTVLRKRPGAVVDDLLELVDRLAQVIESLGDFVIGHGLRTRR